MGRPRKLRFKPEALTSCPEHYAAHAQRNNPRVQQRFGRVGWLHFITASQNLADNGRKTLNTVFSRYQARTTRVNGTHYFSRVLLLLVLGCKKNNSDRPVLQLFLRSHGLVEGRLGYVCGIAGAPRGCDLACSFGNVCMHHSSAMNHRHRSRSLTHSHSTLPPQPRTQ